MGLDANLYLFLDNNADKVIEFLEREDEIWREEWEKHNKNVIWPTEEDRQRISKKVSETATLLGLPKISSSEEVKVLIGFKRIENSEPKMIENQWDEGFMGISNYMNDLMNDLFKEDFWDILSIQKDQRWIKPNWDKVKTQLLNILEKTDWYRNNISEVAKNTSYCFDPYDELIWLKTILERILFSVNCILSHPLKEQMVVFWSV